MNTYMQLASTAFLAAALVACGTPTESALAAHAGPQRTDLPAISAGLGFAERAVTGHRTAIAGTVVAQKSAAVSSRVTAMVTAVHVEMGDEVRAGQTLISIDPSAAEGQVAQARGALAQAEAALSLARRNHERFLALAATTSASELEVDMARMQFDQARGAVEEARGAVAAAQSVARESRVVAPFDGRVSARFVDVGDLAAPGRPLATIESSAGRRLVVAVPESIAQAAALAPGDTLAVALDARPDLGKIFGHVAELSPGPDPVTHAYTLKIDLPFAGLADSASAPIATGAAGRVYLPTGRRDAVSAPRAALIESGGLTLVVVRDNNGLAQSRVVTLGEGDANGWVEILSGLAGGEELALGLTVAPPAGTRLGVQP